ncbi:MAG: hypothetical protein PHU21_01665, partial [Elusimicrobia bacterium]|nr:hypothetical protein [Elusimicrobiota bacterium]
ASYRVVNASRGAATTAIAKGLFLKAVDEVRPRIVTLMIGAANYWNFTGFHPPGRPFLARALVDALRNIRVLKLIRLLRRPWQSRPPGAAAAAWPREVGPCRQAARRADLSSSVIGLLEAGRVDAARRAVSAALAAQPEAARPLALAGFVEVVAQDPARARPRFAAALRRSPGDAYARVGLIGVGPERGPSACRSLERVLAAAPPDALLCRIAGHIAEDRAGPDCAAALFQSSLRLDPCQPDTWLAVGRLRRDERRSEAARAGKAPAAPGAVAPAPAARAEFEALLNGGRYDEILALCTARRLARPPWQELCIGAPEALRIAGAPERQVLRLARHILRLRPGDYRPLLVMGEEELNKKRGREAEAFFAQAASLRPRDAGLVFAIALKLLYHDQVPLARQWAERGRRLAPEAPDFDLLTWHSYRRRGTKMGDPAAAEPWARRFREHARLGRRLVYWKELQDQPMDELMAEPEGPAGAGADEASLPRLEAWIRSDIREIAAECRRRGIRLVIMDYPEGTGFARYAGYRELAASEGAVFVDVHAAFARLREQGVEAGYYSRDGHCNAAGYGLIARTLADGLKRAGLVP